MSLFRSSGIERVRAVTDRCDGLQDFGKTNAGLIPRHTRPSRRVVHFDRMHAAQRSDAFLDQPCARGACDVIQHQRRLLSVFSQPMHKRLLHLGQVEQSQLVERRAFGLRYRQSRAISVVIGKAGSCNRLRNRTTPRTAHRAFNSIDLGNVAGSQRDRKAAVKALRRSERCVNDLRVHGSSALRDRLRVNLHGRAPAAVRVRGRRHRKPE